MKKIKPITALLLVFLAQGNVFAHSFYSLKDEGQKLEKDNKKISNTSAKKQSMSRFGESGKLIAKKILPQNFYQVAQALVPKTIALVTSKNVAQADFSTSRLMCFGCCMQAS